MMDLCTKCGHPVDAHFRDKTPVPCTVVMYDADFPTCAERAEPCGCLEAVRLADGVAPTFPVDEHLPDSTLQRMKKVLYG